MTSLQASIGSFDKTSAWVPDHPTSANLDEDIWAIFGLPQVLPRSGSNVFFCNYYIRFGK